MARILSTNGGPRPPETWAMATAEQVFDIGSTVAGDRLIQAQNLQPAIAEALMPHHTKNQDDLRAKLSEDSKNIFVAPDIDDQVDAVMKDILHVAKGTPWQAHF